MNTAISHEDRLDMARGHTPADLCITNVQLCNVHSGRIIPDTALRVGGGVIVGFGPGPAHCTVDGGGHYLAPGFMDAHVHIESSMLCPAQFARLVLPLGTTCVVADPHEIANVLGVQGLGYMLDSSESLPLDVRIMLPSCVPATPFEHAGAVLLAQDLQPFMNNARVAGLGEMMNYPGVLHKDPQVLAKLALAQEQGKVCDGHAPLLKGVDLDAYALAGITTDHECTSLEEMQDRLDRGMYVAIRQGSAARNLPDLIPGVTAGNASQCLLCTDDRHPGDILEKGHMNYLLRLCVELGLDPMLALRMATRNTAQCYGLRNKGGISPGMDADLVLLEDLRSFRPLAVYAKGRKVAEDGTLCVDIASPTPEFVTGAVRPAPLTAQHLSLPLPGGRARVMGLQAHSLVSLARIRPVQTLNGLFDPAGNPALTKIAVIERHKGTGNVGLGLLEGYTAPGKSLGGAIATTIAHDSHNIVVAGDNDRDILAAVEDLQRMGGGITLSRDGRVLDHLPLPVAGLMSDQSAEEVHAHITRLLALARSSFGIHPDIEPFMTLSFMALAVIPELKLTDQGLFDVLSFSFVPVAVE